MTRGTIVKVVLGILLFFFIVGIFSPKETEDDDDDFSLIDYTIRNEGERVSSKCWIPKNRTSCAPQFIFTGHPKSGANAAYSYLLEHPDVLPLQNFVIDTKKSKTVLNKRDSRFFSDPTWMKLLDEYSDDEEVRGFYFDLFPEISPPTFEEEDNEFDEYEEENTNSTVGKITGEYSETYFNQLYVPLRVKKFLPHVKVIFFLRNPIDRAYSDFSFRKRISFIEEKEDQKLAERGITRNDVFMDCFRVDIMILQFCKIMKWYKFPLELSNKDVLKCYNDKVNEITSSPPLTNHTECVGGFYHSFFCTPFDYNRHCPRRLALDSIYAFFLRTWANTLPSNNILIIQTESFYRDPAYVMQQISDFLEISDRDFDWNEVIDNLDIDVNPFDIITAGGEDSDYFHPKFVSNFDQVLEPQYLMELKMHLDVHNIILGESLRREEFTNWFF